MPTAANPASPRPSTARHEMLPRQVCQASSSTAGVSAITPPKSVPQPGTPSTITPAPPTASTASAPAVRDLRVNRPPAAAAVTSVAVANAPNVEFPNPKNRPPVTGPSANMLPTCSGVLSTPSTSSTTYAAATTPSTARQFRTRYDAVATAALIASVTRYRLRPGSGQRHHCVRVLRYTALKNPPCASIVATNTRRDRRVCRSLYQASASSCAARIVSPTATSMTSGCANRSLVSSRSRITAAVSACTSPPACTSLPSSGASGALSDSRVAVRSVSWINPGRRVVLLVSQRGPSSGGSCIATSVSRCAPAISSPTPASTTRSPGPGLRQDRAVRPRDRHRAPRPEPAQLVAQGTQPSQLGVGVVLRLQIAVRRPSGDAPAVDRGQFRARPARLAPPGPGTGADRQPPVDRTGLPARRLHRDRPDVRLPDQRTQLRRRLHIRPPQPGHPDDDHIRHQPTRPPATRGRDTRATRRQPAAADRRTRERCAVSWIRVGVSAPGARRSTTRRGRESEARGRRECGGDQQAGDGGSGDTPWPAATGHRVRRWPGRLRWTSRTRRSPPG